MADVVELLVESGLDPNDKDKFEQTPIHMAAARGHLAVAKILVKHGADVHRQMSAGYTPLQLARHAEHHEVATYLQEQMKLQEKRRPQATARAPSTGAAAGVEVTLLVSLDELKAADIVKIAIPAMSGAGVEAHFLDILSQTAVRAASRQSHVSVIGASDIEAMLGFEQQKDLLGCNEVSCVAEIGGALGVDAILTLKLGKLGSTYTVDVALIHIGMARPFVRAGGQVKGEPDVLLGVVEEAVQAVLGYL